MIDDYGLLYYGKGHVVSFIIKDQIAHFSRTNGIPELDSQSQVEEITYRDDDDIWRYSQYENFHIDFKEPFYRIVFLQADRRVAQVFWRKT